MISASELRELVDYDQTEGKFVWKIGRKGRSAYAGGPAGRFNPHDGYIRIGIRNVRYKAHRLAWLFVYGEFPPGDIDHINGNRTDNRICNLRCASKSQNLANTRRPSHNTSGYKGVGFRNGKWRATIKKDNHTIHIGVFSTVAEAQAAYIKKATELFGVFARAA